jgi:hypothetical protein
MVLHFATQADIEHDTETDTEEVDEESQVKP